MNATLNCLIFPHMSLLFLVVDDVNVRGKELLDGSIEVAQLLDFRRHVFFFLFFLFF